MSPRIHLRLLKPLPMAPRQPACMHVPADDPGGVQAVLDMGTLVDAIHVGNGSHLELRSLRIPNCASRHVHKPSQRVRLRVAGIFALWPSITLAINSSVSIAPASFPTSLHGRDLQCIYGVSVSANVYPGMCPSGQKLSSGVAQEVCRMMRRRAEGMGDAVCR